MQLSMQEGAKEGHCEAGHFLWHTRAWQWQNVPQQPFGMASAGAMAQASNLLLPSYLILQRNATPKFAIAKWQGPMTLEYVCMLPVLLTTLGYILYAFVTSP
jgi:hypothetical protein